jgi:hypothetical protein
MAAPGLLALTLVACGAEPNAEAPEDTQSVQGALSGCTPQAQPVLVATASSRQAAAFAPKYAIDGVSTTRWSSDLAAEQWLMLDLGKVVNVTSLNINWQTAYSKAFRIESSPDGVSGWHTFITSGATKAGPQTVTGVASTRYLRIYSTQATGWRNVSIVDAQVRGTLDSACPNLLPGPWRFKSSDLQPSTLDPSTFYSVSGNGISFAYSGKSFTVPYPPPIAGLHFTQSVSVVQGGQYRLRLDVSNLSGATTTLFWASLSGAASPADFITIDGNSSGAIDFTVSAAPGPTPVLELVNKPLTAFPGFGLQDFTVKATLTRTN